MKTTAKIPPTKVDTEIGRKLTHNNFQRCVFHIILSASWNFMQNVCSYHILETEERSLTGKEKSVLHNSLLMDINKCVLSGNVLITEL